MELILLDPPANGYKPGDKVSGMVTYDIASYQATIYDVRLYFDGNLFIRPFRCKFEAHRSAVTLVEESQILFQGPFTLRQQRMNWHLTLEVPSTVTTDGVVAPVPPSMDHRFREGLQITVRYSIAATVRLGSDPVSAHPKPEILNVRPLIELTTYECWSRTLLFPALEIFTDYAPQLSRLRFWSISSLVGVDSGGPKQTFQFEMTLPSMLFLDQRETVVCSMKTIAGMDHSSGHDRFCITKLEFILRSRLTWQDRLEILQCVATTTTRPGTEVFDDGHPVPLPDTIGLQDFRSKGVMTAPFYSYDSVFPEVSHTFTLVVKAAVGHVKSGLFFHFKGLLPVIVHEEAVTEVFPPAYSCSDVVESIPPPSYLKLHSYRLHPSPSTHRTCRWNLTRFITQIDHDGSAVVCSGYPLCYSCERVVHLSIARTLVKSSVGSVNYNTHHYGIFQNGVSYFKLPGRRNGEISLIS